jgi:hypothetical protein
MQTIGSSAATDLPNICFMGSNILSGAGAAVVIQTRRRISRMLIRQRAPTSFGRARPPDPIRGRRVMSTAILLGVWV